MAFCRSSCYTYDLNQSLDKQFFENKFVDNSSPMFWAFKRIVLQHMFGREKMKLVFGYALLTKGVLVYIVLFEGSIQA